jgi:hypothetical protein
MLFGAVSYSRSAGVFKCNILVLSSSSGHVYIGKVKGKVIPVLN